MITITSSKHSNLVVGLLHLLTILVTITVSPTILSIPMATPLIHSRQLVNKAMGRIAILSKVILQRHSKVILSQYQHLKPAMIISKVMARHLVMEQLLTLIRKVPHLLMVLKLLQLNKLPFQLL